MTNEELAEIRAYVAQRQAARARGEHIDSDERREAALLAALDKATRERDEARGTNERWERASARRRARLDVEWQRLARDLAEARSQLAALHAAANALTEALAELPFGSMGINAIRAINALDIAVSRAAVAAREHDARVRADERVKALREAAEEVFPSSCTPTSDASDVKWEVARSLRKLAAEAEVSR